MKPTGFGQSTLSGEVLKATDGAVLFVVDGTGREFWVPRRVCLDGDSLEEGDTDICIADWWLKQQGVE